MVERFQCATAFPGRSEGLRYAGVNLLAGLAKESPHGSADAWFKQRNISGLALQPSEHLVRDTWDPVPVKNPALRRLVKAALTQRFGVTARDMSSEFWQYDGVWDGIPVSVVIRYSGRMTRPQLDYQVQVRRKDGTTAIPNLCFASLLGVSFGRWNYLTQENAAHSVELLCALVQYVATFPERLAKVFCVPKRP